MLHKIYTGETFLEDIFGKSIKIGLINPFSGMHGKVPGL